LVTCGSSFEALYSQEVATAGAAGQSLDGDYEPSGYRGGVHEFGVERFTEQCAAAVVVVGPVDVAVISKGDGLIWIKRKHYFAPDLNHRYFDRDQDLSSGITGGKA